MSLGRALLYAATAAAMAFAARALFVEPPPFTLAVLFGLAYAVLLFVGAMSPQLEMYGSVLCRVPEAEGCVALTFDDGPDPTSTPGVLDELARAGVKATFFVIGEKAARHPELLARMVSEGHCIGLHGYDHYRAYALLPPAAVERDVRRSRDAIEKAAGVRPQWLRPPVGQISPRTASGARRAEATLVGWSVKARDGLRAATSESVLRRVSAGLQAGAIVLLHDAWERAAPSDSKSAEAAPAGARALASILATCRARNLEPVTLDELVRRGSRAAETKER